MKWAAKLDSADQLYLLIKKFSLTSTLSIWGCFEAERQICKLASTLMPEEVDDAFRACHWANPSISLSTGAGAGGYDLYSERSGVPPRCQGRGGAAASIDLLHLLFRLRRS